MLYAQEQDLKKEKKITLFKRMPQRIHITKEYKLIPKALQVNQSRASVHSGRPKIKNK